MISRDEVEKLADLAHIAIAEGELDTLTGEFDAILAYVSEIDKLAGAEADTKERAVVHNVMREDVATNKPGEYTKKIVREMPDTEGNALRVKKIL